MRIIGSHKATLQIPWDADTGALTPLTRESGTYAIPIIYRATRLRCNSLTRVPYYINDESQPYFYEKQLPMRELLWYSEASLLLKGAAYILKLRNRFRYGKGLQLLNPFTMEAKYEDGELLFWQQIPGGERFPRTGYWTADDMIYIREFNPRDDLGTGVCAADVALHDANASLSVSRFFANFFASDAIPVTMVSLPRGAKKEQTDQVSTWFTDRIQGFKNRAARVLGVSGEIKVEKLTSNLADYDFQAIDDHVLKSVSHAFEVPKTMLNSESANYATARTEFRQYLDQTLIPRTKVFEQHLNDFLEEVGEEIKFAPEELPEMQTEESERAGAFKSLVESGIAPRAALDILGYSLSQNAEKEQKQFEEEKKKTPTIPPQLQTATEGAGNEGQQPPTLTPEAKSDLDKLLRKSLSKMRNMGIAEVHFESEYIPNEMKSDIFIGLRGAKTEEDIKKVFETVRGNNHANGEMGSTGSGESAREG